jgi:hypothetical protein
MIARLVVPSLIVCASLAAGCGSDDGSSASPDSGVCGTASAPGILKVVNRSPALQASVANQHIVHTFTVLGAPGDYKSLRLVYGEGHTAGVSSPDDPTFKTTISGSDINYQMTIDSWGSAPGHVVLRVKDGFATAQGCNWVFPSPLFEYDITAGPTADGGAVIDAKPSVDGASPIDVAAMDTSLDTAIDAPAGVDGSVTLDLASEAPTIDARAIDVAVVDLVSGLDAGAVDGG